MCYVYPVLFCIKKRCIDKTAPVTYLQQNLTFPSSVCVDPAKRLPKAKVRPKSGADESPVCG